MKKAFLACLMISFSFSLQAQYTEEWSDPVLLTDAESYNSSPEVLVAGNQTYMFYEKKFTPDGPSAIYFREIKTMGAETAVLADPVHYFRNPVVLEFIYPDPGYCLFYESDISGNFDLYAVQFNGELVFEEPFQLTFTSGDERKASYDGNYNLVSWETNGNVLAAKISHSSELVALEDTQTLDFMGCSDPICCNSRVVYLKMQEDSAAVYYSDWDFSLGQWGDPVAMDTTGNNSHCSCDRNMWFFSAEDCIVYEKDGQIFNYFYDEIYALELDGFNGDMHQPHSHIYDIPVDNLPAPVFVTFSSQAEGDDDIFVYWSVFGEPVINVSEDTLVNANPEFSWGWYAQNPCSRYLLNIWESEQDGFRPLYMSKCALYVCGGTEENSGSDDRLEVFPNPFRDELNIRFYHESSEDVVFEIRNMNGRILKAWKAEKPGSGWNEYRVEPDRDIPPGILYLTIREGDRHLFRKVIYK